ncbi:MAG: dihydrodipicolinate synthase family protein [Oscillospiraceae bacterium]|nr:dihydrodipicolinate synthase family protein [Oscillospiraceae bacterium]
MSLKPQEMKEKIKGIFHLSLTPFDKNGDLNVPALRESIRMVTENKDLEGEDIVFLALGTTGEFYAMSEAENKTVVDVVCEEVNGKFPVMIGSGRAGTKNTVEFSKYAQAAGADGLLVVPPYYTMPTTDGIIRHFETLAESVDIGITIYNNPAASKLWLPMPVIQRLSKVDNIIGLKENTNNPNAFLSMMQNIDPNDMSIFAGLGHFMYQYMCFHGCKGYVTEMLNYAPHLALDLYHAGQAGDIAKVRETADKMNLFWNWVFRLAAKYSPVPSAVHPGKDLPTDMPYYQAANKAAAVLCGMPAGYAREPMENIPEGELAELREILKQMGCNVVA